MKQHKKAGWAGIILVAIFFIMNVYFVFRNSEEFGVKETLLPELGSALLTQIPLIIPAIVLFTIKNFKQKYIFVAWLYPIIIGLGYLNVLLSDDALAAGLPMVVIVIPACIILAIVFFFLKEKENKLIA